MSDKSLELEHCITFNQTRKALHNISERLNYIEGFIEGQTLRLDNLEKEILSNRIKDQEYNNKIVDVIKQQQEQLHNIVNILNKSI